jgi:8-oxo-dGTP pyrophosphatase MutT (NUDIX family)
MNIISKKNIICVNCGKMGHIYKRCNLPITSYGIICIKLDGININDLLNISNKIEVEKENIDINDIIHYRDLLKNVDEIYLKNNLKFLMIKRRISFSIMEFIRGKYKLDDIEYILNTLRLMTNNEKNNLLNYNFDYNWNNLWNINSNNLLSNYSREYNDSKYRFNKIKEGYEINIYNNKTIITLNELIKLSGTEYNDTEWGFPKGKKDFEEIDIDCAKREFEEETDFKNDDYIILKINNMNELFMGSNNIKYKNKYYIGQIIKDKNIEININNEKQIMEIGDIGMFSYEECLNNIRPYDIEKKNVISNLNFILTYFIINLKNKIEKLAFN